MKERQLSGEYRFSTEGIGITAAGGYQQLAVIGQGKSGLAQNAQSENKGLTREAVLLVKRLLSENLPEHAKPFAVAVLCMLLVAGSTAAVAFLTRSMVNDIFVAGNRQAIWSVGTAVMVAYLIKGGAGYIQLTIMASIGTAIVGDLQKRAFGKILQLQITEVTKRHPGQIVVQAVQSARAAKDVVMLVATNLIRDVMTVIALAIVMVLQDPLMSLFAFLASPLIVLAIVHIVRKTREIAKTELDLMAGVTSAATETLQGFKVVKSYNLQKIMGSRINHAIEQMQEKQLKLQRIMLSTSPMMETLGGLIIGSFIFYTGWQTLANDKTPGEFVAFLTAFLMAYEPAKRLANFHVVLNRQLMKVERLYSIIDNINIEDNPDIIYNEFSSKTGRLRFDDVYFRYDKNKPAIEGVSFEVLPGEKVALVGRSGAGKSTIIDLILGIYRPKKGTILIDDTSSAKIRLTDLRSCVAYVSQETFLFAGTISENIGYGKQGYSVEDISNAAETAGAMSFINSLSDGLETDIGDNGNKLSGGERQRISIARAIIKNAPILLLDEATSALDGETERNIKAALAGLSKDRTTIIVAHRLSTIEEADKVIVLDKGRVVGQGTHEELGRTSTIYRSLFSNGKYVD